MSTRTLQRKVPEVTVFFWIIKLLTTAMGEVVSDFLVFHINPYFSVISGFICFVFALWLQLSVRKYIPWVYWFCAGMVAVFGTMAADVIHVVIGIPYLISALIFAVALTINFCLWYKWEKSLSIHSIYTTRRELFYWLTVIVTFALGTATGDLTASTFGLGYFISGILFTALILIPFVGYRKFKLHEVFAFWTAYIITRPLGASFADWIGKPKNAGGLGIGTGIVSIIFIILIIACVVYISTDTREIKEEGGNASISEKERD